MAEFTQLYSAAFSPVPVSVGSEQPSSSDVLLIDSVICISLIKV